MRQSLPPLPSEEPPHEAGDKSPQFYSQRMVASKRSQNVSIQREVGTPLRLSVAPLSPGSACRAFCFPLGEPDNIVSHTPALPNTRTFRRTVGLDPSLFFLFLLSFILALEAKVLVSDIFGEEKEVESPSIKEKRTSFVMERDCFDSGSSELPAPVNRVS